MAFIVKLLVTMGFVGFARPFPGTIASAIAVGIVYFSGDARLPPLIFIATLTAGLLLAAPGRRVLGGEDPAAFVLDEWCGMTLAVLFVPPEPAVLATGFFLFRFFDVVKPLGIRRIDRWPHPASVILDDVAAGLYANIVLQAGVRLTPLFSG